MSESLLNFVGQHPFWAAIIIIFMILPIAGAVFHIVIKALGGRGVDNSPPAGIPSDYDGNDSDHPEDS